MKQKAEPVTASFKSQSKDKYIHYLRPKLVAGAAILIVIIVAVVLIENHRNYELTHVCSGHLISQAYSDMKDHNNQSLGNQVNDIYKFNNYKNDPNCMYIATVYYVNTVNSNIAQSSFNKFMQDYTSTGNRLSPVLYKYASPSVLSTYVTNVASLNPQEAQILKNSEQLSTPAKYSQKDFKGTTK